MLFGFARVRPPLRGYTLPLLLLSGGLVAQGPGPFFPDERLAVGTLPGLPVHAAAVGDLDGQGLDDDVVLVTAPVLSAPGAVTVRRSEGGGRLGPPVVVSTIIRPSAAPAIGDVDGDGLGDLILVSHGTSLPGQVEVLRNLGTRPLSFASQGTWLLPSTALGPVIQLGIGPVVAGDFDGDGRDDVVIAISDAILGSVHGLMGAAAGPGGFFPGGFRLLTTLRDSADFLAIEDLDASDGRGAGEVVVGRTQPGFAYASYLRGPVDPVTPPALVDLPLVSPGALQVADFDGDGRLDLFSESGSVRNPRILVQQAPTSTGDLRFRTLAIGARAPFSTGWSPAPQVGDLDGDGRPDIVGITRNLLSSRLVVMASRSGWRQVDVGLDPQIDRSRIPTLRLLERDGRAGPDAIILPTRQGQLEADTFLGRTGGATFAWPGTLDSRGRHGLRLDSGFDGLVDGRGERDAPASFFRFSWRVQPFVPALVGSPVGLVAHVWGPGEAAPTRLASPPGLWFEPTRAFWVLDPLGSSGLLANPGPMPAAGFTLDLPWSGGALPPGTRVLVQALGFESGRLLGSEAHLIRF